MWLFFEMINMLILALWAVGLFCLSLMSLIELFLVYVSAAFESERNNYLNMIYITLFLVLGWLVQYEFIEWLFPGHGESSYRVISLAVWRFLGRDH